VGVNPRTIEELAGESEMKCRERGAAEVGGKRVEGREKRGSAGGKKALHGEKRVFSEQREEAPVEDAR